MILGGEKGISFHSYEDKTGHFRLFVPKEVFSEYFVDDFGEDEDLDNGFCINHNVFIDFLHLSLIRGNRLIELTSWYDLDHINLKYSCYL